MQERYSHALDSLLCVAFGDVKFSTSTTPPVNVTSSHRVFLPCRTIVKDGEPLVTLNKL